MRARRNTNPPLCFTHFAMMHPEEFSEFCRKAGMMPKRPDLKLPKIETPADANKALVIILDATARGKITLRTAQRLEAQVRLFLQTYQQKTIDFEEAWKRREAELKEKMIGRYLDG